MASIHIIMFDNILAGSWGGQGTQLTNFKMALKEIQHKDMDRIQLAQDRIKGGLVQTRY
jgi:hypothetical protein